MREAKRRIIDALGCAIGAAEDDAPRAAARIAARVSAEPGATTLYGDVSSPDQAAFVNGILIRYLDYNDTYLGMEPAHPSDNLAAVLAAAEAAGANGREVIVATVLAYEVQCRLADAASIRSRGWDHVCYGSFSTALAAGRLLGLSIEQLEHAQAISAVGHMAMRQSRAGELSMWKGCAFANSARNGVLAAMLAAEGMTGPAPIFEGEFGFFAEVAGAPFNVGPLAGAEGDAFAVEASHIKNWPAEYHAQSAIQAALELRDEVGDPLAIERVVVNSFDAAVQIIGSGPERWAPATRETADHSLPYCTAIALIDGEVGPKQFSPERFTDPDVLELLRRVEVRSDPAFTARYPQAIVNRVVVFGAAGRRAERQVEFPKGHVRNPLTDDELEQKFRGLAAGRLDKDRQDELLGRVWRLDELDEIASILPVIAVSPLSG